MEMQADSTNSIYLQSLPKDPGEATPITIIHMPVTAMMPNKGHCAHVSFFMLTLQLSPLPVCFQASWS